MNVTIHRYLALARNALGMDLAWLSEVVGGEQLLRVVDGETRPFNVVEGDALSWEGSFCTRVLDGRLPNIIPDARANPITAALPVTEQLGIGSYVGSPVRLPDGSFYGMLCCISRAPHQQLKDHQAQLIQAIATSLGAELGDEAIQAHHPDSTLQRITRAIEGNDLRIVVQPIVDLSTMNAVGVEALSRFGFAPGPDKWFARATELGLGTLLEIASIRAALSKLNELPEHLYMSVNASPSTLCNDDILRAIDEADASRVVVEITEHASVLKYDELLACIDLLRQRGVRIAIDDAGAGYASFRHILSVHPDIIKIDREMVTRVDSDPARKALLTAFVGFATEIGAALVAEGIETVGELDMLRELGVQCGQGHYLAKPQTLPLEQANALHDRAAER
jgi:EAL domain-containing protein (putative c-di-GMP-specific phosphodiesterase class I)